MIQFNISKWVNNLYYECWRLYVRMKMLTAYTYEIDDVSSAVSEIHSQLEIEKNLESNSVGILTCYSEFIDTGVVYALCESLPFDIIGCTTLAGASDKNNGLMMLNLTVITGDDIEVSAVVSEPLKSGMKDEIIDNTYKNAVSKISTTPKIIIPFIPLYSGVDVESMLMRLDSVSDGVPIFGNVTCDHNLEVSNSEAVTIFGGNKYSDSISMVVISGEINPTFVTASTSDINSQKQKAIITKSEGNKLVEVNNVPTREYLNSIGLSSGRTIEGISSIPFIINYNDGSQPITRVIYSVDENGFALCSGNIPEGSTISTGSMDYQDVLSTTDSVMKKIKEMDDKKGLLIFVCMSRCKLLGVDSLAEIKVLSKYIENDVPCHVCYSGGELSPVKNMQHDWINRMHNFSFIACVFS